MRTPSFIIGLILLIAGGIVLFQGGYVTKRREILDVGGLEIAAEEKKAIAPWVAGVALIAGTALVIAGLSTDNTGRKK